MYKDLPHKSEIDFGGLQKYLNEKLPNEIKIYLFDTDPGRRVRCKEAILSAAYDAAQATNNDRKKVINTFMDSALDIAKEYYKDKLDGNHKLLLNITVDSILSPMHEGMDTLSSQISDIPQKTADLTIKGMADLTANNIQPDIPHYITSQPPPTGNEFSYRDGIVEELYVAIKQNRKLALINGMGGIGKTSVARNLYHKVKDEFKHVAWVEYQNSIKESLSYSLIMYLMIRI